MLLGNLADKPWGGITCLRAPPIIGVASLHPDSSATFRDLLIQADKALHLAKNAGRNCVRIYPPPEPA